MKKHPEFLLPSQIIDWYPEIGNRFTPRELGYLFMLGLIQGRRTSEGTLLKVESVQRFHALIQSINFRERIPASHG